MQVSKNTRKAFRSVASASVVINYCLSNERKKATKNNNNNNKRKDKSIVVKPSSYLPFKKGTYGTLVFFISSHSLATPRLNNKTLTTELMMSHGMLSRKL
jgi:hypothetical protein